MPLLVKKDAYNYKFPEKGKEKYFMDWRDLNYYINENGDIDQLVDSMGDCILQSIYLIERKVLNKPDFYIAFLNEITMILGETKHGDFIRINNIENVMNKSLFELIMHSGINEKAPEKITEIINSGSAAIMHVIIERFPFAQQYDPKYLKSEIRSEHAFLIVHEDEENYYFVDNPAIVRRENFTTYEKNPQIGILSKKDFSLYTKDYCDVYEVKFNIERINDAIINWKSAYFNSYVNYYKPEETLKSKRNLYGKLALNELRKVFEEERFTLDDLAPTNDRDMMKYFLWRIWILKGRRMLQKFYLDSLNERNGNKYSSLADALLNDIKSWEKFSQELVKNDIHRKNVLGKQYLPLIDGIIECEDKLNIEYGKLFSINF